jgi:hypothetical protein
MIQSGKLTSLLIPSQLPGFIRDNPDYTNFVTFVKAYYEWLETNGQITDASKNLLTYKDIDTTSEQFLDYFINDFLSYFPNDALISKEKAVKVARELYKSKGTPASYEFLFRILYNSGVEIFNTKDAILKASDGVWYVTRSLRLLTTDENWLHLRSTIGDYRVFGETSKSIAVIENVFALDTKMEVFVSNIERQFQSGEFVTVMDSNNQPILFNGVPLRAKVVGQVNKITIDPSNRGLFYQPGDPVAVYGGLSSATGNGATAQVGTTTAGSINRVNVLQGGYGYQNSPNTKINVTNVTGTALSLGSLDPDASKAEVIGLIPSDAIISSISPYNYGIGNTQYKFLRARPTANANTTLANAFTFLTLSTYPISSVLVDTGGSSILTTPTIVANSVIQLSSNTGVSTGLGDLASLGILAPIQIVSRGLYYKANDVIQLIGGTGAGANAKVTGVYANGAIANVSYVTANSAFGNNYTYPLGGMGYNPAYLPTPNIISSNATATGAVLTVPGIMGAGATFSSVTDTAGAISSITLLSPGQDYTSAPSVSLKVQDILVKNLSATGLPQKGDAVYQGSSFAAGSYVGYVDNIILLVPNSVPTQSIYILRVYNYSSAPNKTLPIYVDGDTSISMNMYGSALTSQYDASGVRYYGDGTALATASFTNGLVTGQGQYLNSRGFPSGFNVLQDQIYNNYTYELSVEKEIAKYRDILLNLLHPLGMQVLGRFKIISDDMFNLNSAEALIQGHTLQYYTGYPASNVSMSTNFTTKSTNIVRFGNLAGANLATYVSNSNTTLIITPTNGPNVISDVISVDPISNNVIIKENVYLTFANVAWVAVNTGTSVINISSLTGLYDIINNGNYSNTAYPVKDIVYVGDTISVDSQTRTVSSVDFSNNKVYVSSSFTTSNANTLLSVNRTFNTTQVKIFGPTGIQYYPELTTEDGQILTTEDGTIILLG